MRSVTASRSRPLGRLSSNGTPSQTRCPVLPGWKASTVIRFRKSNRASSGCAISSTPDDLSRDRERFLEQIAAREPIIRGQYRIRHRDGRWINVKTAGAAEYDPSGKLVSIVGCTIDTAETSVLEESHARLAAVIAHSNDAIFSIDIESQILTWNQGAARLYGYEGAEVIGGPLAALIPDEERAASQRAVEEILGGETRVFQALRRHRDGRALPVEISGAPIRSPGGRVLGISTIHRDVSGARKTALADAKFAAVVGASHDAIITLDSSGEIESWNRGAEELFGWPAAEAIGRSIAFIVPEDRSDEHKDIMTRLMLDEKMIVETVRLTRGGRRVSVAASFSPFRDRGELAGSAVTFRDISERIARETHIHLLLKELSHRSKNLLAIVQGIARQSAMRTSDFKVFLDNFTARLRALAHSHDLIVQENWHGADMHALVAMQTSAFEIAPDVVRTSGERMLVKPEAAQNIGLSLHELASNAIRYGALSTPHGHIEISWGFVERNGKNRLRMIWREVGGPAARLPTKSGFGILVLSQITPRALGGDATLNADDTGLEWVLEVPAENIVAKTD